MMYSRKSPKVGVDLLALAGLAFLGTTLIMGGGGGYRFISAYPAASIDVLNRLNKLGEKHDHIDQATERDFRHFIHSKDSSDPTFIGEIKPNASDLEQMILRTKIATAILNMQQESEKSSAPKEASSDQSGECFIEITKVERIPGKCHRVNNGLPICQSDNYMAINSECS